MNKVFFPPTGDVQVARAKVWQPSVEEAARDAQLYAQVTKFKFFGRSATGDTGAVAKNFVLEPIGVPKQKDASQAAVDLNGALFAACLSDQTAAAGSPQTANLSAFTYGITSALDTSASLSDLNQRVGARLKALNMNQTPTAEAPPMHPELLTETFITMGQVGGVPAQRETDGGVAPPPSGDGFDPYAWLRQQLGVLT
jgi:hypothetical protein